MKALITPKMNPDLDGLACAYAYARLLKKQGKAATEGIWGQPHVEAGWVMKKGKAEDVVFEPPGQFDEFILVDASSLRGMPEVISAEKVIEVIDHRIASDVGKLFPNAKMQIEKVGAAATLIGERYQKAGIKIDKKSAILLYGAIYSNTLNLKAKVTSERDQKMANWLARQAAIPKNLVKEMFAAKTKAIANDIEKAIISDFKEFEIGKVRVGVPQLEVVGLNKLVKDNRGKIYKTLKEVKSEHGLDWILLTAVDLEEDFNLFVSQDKEAQEVVKKLLGVKFEKGIAIKEGLMLRKELFARLIGQLKTGNGK
jgi:manganese-dependent inorganic pyrophosphatase